MNVSSKICKWVFESKINFLLTLVVSSMFSSILHLQTAWKQKPSSFSMLGLVTLATYLLISEAIGTFTTRLAQKQYSNKDVFSEGCYILAILFLDNTPVEKVFMIYGKILR